MLKINNLLLLDELIYDFEIDYRLGNYINAKYKLQSFSELVYELIPTHISVLNNIQQDILKYNLEYNTTNHNYEHLQEIVSNIKRLKEGEYYN